MSSSSYQLKPRAAIQRPAPLHFCHVAISPPRQGLDISGIRCRIAQCYPQPVHGGIHVPWSKLTNVSAGHNRAWSSSPEIRSPGFSSNISRTTAGLANEFDPDSASPQLMRVQARFKRTEANSRGSSPGSSTRFGVPAQPLSPVNCATRFAVFRARALPRRLIHSEAQQWDRPWPRGTRESRWPATQPWPTLRQRRKM